MTKVIRKEKVNYLRGVKTYLDNTISFDNISNNNININNINTTLTNISNQLKNIAIVDKNKEFKLLNSSFHINNNNFKNNITSNKKKNINNINNINNTNNNYINTSMNIENNYNKSNFFDITANLEINQKFQDLQIIKVFNFYILKKLNYDNCITNIDEIKKENMELKENIKFLLKQIKKYQKNGITIEDMNLNRQQELENYQKQIKELKQEIISYKNKIVSLINNNKELIKDNKELREFIDISISKTNINKNNEKDFKSLNNSRNKYSLKNKKLEYEQFYDIAGFDEKNLEYNNLNAVYNYKNKNNLESDNNSKLSEELLADINCEITSGRNKSYFLYNQNYTTRLNHDKKQRTNFSEGKLYCKKNVGIKHLNINDESYYNTKKNSNKNISYSKNHFNNNNSLKNQ